MPVSNNSGPIKRLKTTINSLYSIPFCALLFIMVLCLNHPATTQIQDNIRYYINFPYDSTYEKNEYD